jgi:hypothetical protein
MEKAKKIRNGDLGKPSVLVEVQCVQGNSGQGKRQMGKIVDQSVAGRTHRIRRSNMSAQVFTITGYYT